jgi:hypothetical protein
MESDDATDVVPGQRRHQSRIYSLTKMVEQSEPGAYQPEKGRAVVWEDAKDALLEGQKKRAARQERTLKQDVSEWLVANSLGMDLSQASLHRYIPTEIYVATTSKQHNANYEIASAFSNLLVAGGFEPLDDSIPKFGSMHWRRVHRTKFRKSAKQLDDRLTFLQVVLTNAFRGQGAQVNGQPEDQAEMETVEITRKAELKKIEAEIEQAKAEIEKAKAETERLKAETKKVTLEARKALLELAHTFAKVIVKASAGFAIVIGTLHLSAPTPPDKPAIVFKIESRKIGPDAKELAGRIWLRLPEGHDTEEREGHDPLDSE